MVSGIARLITRPRIRMRMHNIYQNIDLSERIRTNHAYIPPATAKNDFSLAIGMASADEYVSISQTTKDPS
jgi:hypothetical protein